MDFSRAHSLTQLIVCTYQKIEKGFWNALVPFSKEKKERLLKWVNTKNKDFIEKNSFETIVKREAIKMTNQVNIVIREQKRKRSSSFCQLESFPLLINILANNAYFSILIYFRFFVTNIQKWKIKTNKRKWKN